MKIKAILFYCCLGLSGLLYAQQPKTEQKESIKFITKYSDKDVTKDDCLIQIVKVTGDIKSQKVKIEFLLTNKIQNRKIFIDGGRSQFVSLSSDYIPMLTGFNVFDTELFTDVPIKTTCTIGTLMPSQKSIKLIALHFGVNQGSMKWAVAEFRDIAIDWN